MAIKGTEKEKKDYKKFVGLFNANVISVNPTKQELEKLLGTNIDKDPEYTGVNDTSGAKKATLSFWLKEEDHGNLFNVRFNLEDTVVESKTGKTQFINTIGNTSYAEDKNKVPEFLTEGGRKIRPAKKGEELLYKFLRAWLNDLNYEDTSTELVLEDWKSIINGKTTELKEAIKNFSNKTVCALATVRTSQEGKEYQGVYSYEFLPSFAMDAIRDGKSYKTIDRFITRVTDKEYGCKDYYELKPLVEYDPTKNVINNTDAPIVNNKSGNMKPTQEVVHDDLPF